MSCHDGPDIGDGSCPDEEEDESDEFDPLEDESDENCERRGEIREILETMGDHALEGWASQEDGDLGHLRERMQALQAEAARVVELIGEVEAELNRGKQKDI